MAKLLTIIIIGVAIYFVLKSYSRNLSARNRDEQRPDERHSANGEDMVRCAHCGVHLPRTESIYSRNQFYCTDQHRLAHQK